MKYFITAFIGACMISACQPSSPDNTNTAVDSTTVNEVSKALSFETRILGTYKGDFGGSPIYITINYCNGSKIAGYNTHKGLRRNLSGTIINKEDKWDIHLSEPGDHEFDGVFSLMMNDSFTTASGSWQPVNNKSLAEKQLTIAKQLKREQEYIGYFSGDHSDFNIHDDGSCTLNYYEKINDSTFSPQMNTLRGTWEKQPDGILINWQPNTAYQQRSTVFTVIKDDRGDDYPISLKGDIFEFSQSLF